MIRRLASGRAARSRKETVFVDIGRLQSRDPNYGLQVDCYVCAKPHAASGLAKIRHGRATTHVPVCDVCMVGDPTDRIARKYLNAPDLDISDGGKLSTEQLDALAGQDGALT